jgi:hypothetical protein
MAADAETSASGLLESSCQSPQRTSDRSPKGLAAMRWPSSIVTLLLFAFFAVFLLYPLAYVLPAAASDQDFEVQLQSLGESPPEKARVMALLQREGATPGRISLPVRSTASCGAW